MHTWTVKTSDLSNEKSSNFFSSPSVKPQDKFTKCTCSAHALRTCINMRTGNRFNYAQKMQETRKCSLLTDRAKRPIGNFP